MNQTIDYYRRLCVRFDAEKSDIVTAYKRLCKIYHPDINKTPSAEEQMKEINLAYYVLKDDVRRKAYNLTHFAAQTQRATDCRAQKNEENTSQRSEQDDALAYSCIEKYFTHLLNEDYKEAYELLCSNDKKFVSAESFAKWRKSVQQLFAMRKFEIEVAEKIDRFAIGENTFAPAQKFHVDILENNLSSGTSDNYRFAKYVIFDQDGWHIFLGYRDLNEIAKVFEDLSIKQEKEEMLRHWNDYRSEHHRGLNMLSFAGFLKETRREVYRHERYHYPMTIAVIKTQNASSGATKAMTDQMMEQTAKILISSLRGTDIPAYIGEGIFVVLFSELKKRHAAMILQRLIDKISLQVFKTIGSKVNISYAQEAFEGGDLKFYVDRLLSKL